MLRSSFVPICLSANGMSSCLMWIIVDQCGSVWVGVGQCGSVVSIVRHSIVLFRDLFVPSDWSYQTQIALLNLI